MLVLDSLWSYFFPQRAGAPFSPTHSLVMFGIGACGKTTILYTLKLGGIITTVPTISRNIENIIIQSTEFTIIDIACTWGSRLLWHYFTGAAGVICVIDSTDVYQLEETKSYLWLLLNSFDDDISRDMPLLVYANKQDHPNAMSVVEVKNRLGLDAIQRHRWHIQGSIAISGVGLMQGMMWMETQVRNIPKTC